MGGFFDEGREGGGAAFIGSGGLEGDSSGDPFEVEKAPLKALVKKPPAPDEDREESLLFEDIEVLGDVGLVAGHVMVKTA